MVAVLRIEMFYTSSSEHSEVCGDIMKDLQECDELD
jgi:hypothetical protein